MSVSHPLLKQLKGHVYELRKDSDSMDIRDHHPNIVLLCQTMEEIFQLGLKAKMNTPFGLLKKDFWSWILALYEERDRLRMPFNIVESIESTVKCKKVHTSTGRGRLFIRTALFKKALKSLIDLLLIDVILLFTTYDSGTSILANEILSEILLSLLHELNKVDFKLELKNASFLDETWHLGVYKKFEFVPCREMGITFAYAHGRAVVVKVEEGSVAAEENQIEPGDVLDELYGHSLHKCNKSLVSSLANKYRGLPVYISIVKGFYVGSIYSPLKPIFEKLKILQSLKPKEDTESKLEDEDTLNSSPNSLTFVLQLLGKFQVKNDDKPKTIDQAISQAMCLTSEPTVILNKHFSEVSACGRKKLYPEVFAFIFGNTTCHIAEEFRCFVLRAPSLQVVMSIISLFGSGFSKTIWEV